VPVAETFGGRETIGEDLEVIPVPGHTPGSTAFLWDGGRHRFLFTGDSVWLDHGEWRAVVLDRAAGRTTSTT
jgi:glyoxylase-like metal-dependent hydrolase (beta-lactamase superfamily II)